MYNTGSYVIRKNEDGTGHIGYLDGGTITISENGKKIVFDCVTENGTKITGSFSPLDTHAELLRQRREDAAAPVVYRGVGHRSRLHS